MTQKKDVTAPYNFVPLSDQVYQPGGEIPSQDSPINDAESGVIAYTLTCDTPFLISGPDGVDGKRFITAPDTDRPIIPGSSLRGMIRNIMEIAAFGKMQFVQDQRFAVRDLARTGDYRERVTADKVQAGWLSSTKNGQIIKPCKMARVRRSEFKRGAENVTLNVDMGSIPMMATRNGHGHPQKGDIVFTGNVPRKKKEFFFFDKSHEEKEVRADVWRKFLDAHAENPTWEKWKKNFYSRKPIPVFWLADTDGHIAHLGMAMMFRLGADNSVHDLIRNSSADHLADDILDLPTRIFGRVADKKSTDQGARQTGFKTRVSFGWAMLDQRCAYDTAEYTTIMARPKPSFVPSYVRQRDFKDTSGKHLIEGAQYRSYMNWPATDPVPEQIRGWKRYPAKPPMGEPPKGGGEAASTLWPITGKNGLTFTGKIRYHNLTQIELGALVWALTWGGDENLRHSMGMGRKFGWGQVKITLDDDHKQAMKAFTAQMENQVKNWRNSRQIQQLRAMADPSVGDQNKNMLAEMVLSAGEKRNKQNDFQEAKKEGAVLPEYPQYPQNKRPSVSPGNPKMAKGKKRNSPPANQTPPQNKAKSIQTRLDGLSPQAKRALLAHWKAEQNK